jgi:hypothetical protein
MLSMLLLLVLAGKPADDCDCFLDPKSSCSTCSLGKLLSACREWGAAFFAALLPACAEVAEILLKLKLSPAAMKSRDINGAWGCERTSLYW